MQLLSYIKSYGNVPDMGGVSDGCKEGLQLKCLLCLAKSALRVAFLQLPSLRLLMICKTRAPLLPAEAPHGHTGGFSDESLGN